MCRVCLRSCIHNIPMWMCAPRTPGHLDWNVSNLEPESEWAALALVSSRCKYLIVSINTAAYEECPKANNYTFILRLIKRTKLLIRPEMQQMDRAMCGPSFFGTNRVIHRVRRQSGAHILWHFSGDIKKMLKIYIVIHLRQRVLPFWILSVLKLVKNQLFEWETFTLIVIDMSCIELLNFVIHHSCHLVYLFNPSAPVEFDCRHKTLWINVF